MKIEKIESLAIQDVKVIKFARFADHRGYFTEIFRKSDLSKLINLDIMQANESFSKKGTVRGLHFQWNPYMAKLVRTVRGHMVDIALDIRIDSPTFGKVVLYDMPASSATASGEWIWVPVGFAHGNFYIEDTIIEYFCSGEYGLGCEAGISPLSKDIDWSLCDIALKEKFANLIKSPSLLITDKDKNGFTLTEWLKNENSSHFEYNIRQKI